MNIILAIAKNTFKETIRHKVLYSIFIFAVAMTLGSLLLNDLSMRQDIKMIKDIGLASISFFGVIMTIFIGSNMIYKEIDKKTIYNVLSKPIQRTEFIIGKFVGLCAVIGTITLGITFVFWLVLAIKGETFPLLFFTSIFFQYLELVFLISFVILFSTITSPIMATFLSLAIYLIGHMTDSLKLLNNAVHSKLYLKIADFLYYFLPNFELTNFKNHVVYNIPIEPKMIIFGAAYIILYTFIILFIAVKIFNKKEF